MGSKRLPIMVLMLLLVILAFTAACGSTDAPDTTTADTETSAVGSDTTVAGPDTTVASTGEPVKIAVDAGFTGFMAFDIELCEKGVLTGLHMLGSEMAGRPVEYLRADNGSDPVVAVDKARQLVESDGVNYVMGPLFSPATKAVTDYLAKSSGIPQCSFMGQPSENLTTANKLAFIPSGLYGSWGYYFGKYVAEDLGFKTVNCVNYEDTAAYDIQAGFEKGFTEGGGTISDVVYAPMDTVDFSAYLSALKPADCTYFWIIGNGAVPFVKQCYDYGLTAPLIIPMSSNLVEEQLADLGDAGIGIVGCDIYTPLLDNPLNIEFTAAYQELYPGEVPTCQGFTGWQAVMLYNAGLEQTGGDTTPSKVIDAMSTISFETPAGEVTMSPYKDAYIGTRDFYIVQTEQVGDSISWVPIHTWEQVLMGE